VRRTIVALTVNLRLAFRLRAFATRQPPSRQREWLCHREVWVGERSNPRSTKASDRSSRSRSESHQTKRARLISQLKRRHRMELVVRLKAYKFVLRAKTRRPTLQQTLLSRSLERVCFTGKLFNSSEIIDIKSDVLLL